MGPTKLGLARASFLLFVLSPAPAVAEGGDVDCDGNPIRCDAANVVCIPADVEALYEAVNNPENANKVVFLPPGTYTLTSTDAIGLERPNQGRLFLQPGMAIIGSNRYNLAGISPETKIDATSPQFAPITNAGPAFTDCGGGTNEATGTVVIGAGAGDVGVYVSGNLVKVPSVLAGTPPARDVAKTAQALVAAVNADPAVGALVFASVPASGGVITLAGLPPFSTASFSTTLAPYGQGVTTPLGVLGFGRVNSLSVLSLGMDNCVANVTVRSTGRVGRMIVPRPGEPFRVKISRCLLQGAFIGASFGNLGCGAVGANSALVFENNLLVDNTIGLFVFNSLSDNAAHDGSIMRTIVKNNRFVDNGTGAQISAAQAGTDNSLTRVYSEGNSFEGTCMSAPCPVTRGLVLTGGVAQFLPNPNDGNHVCYVSRGDAFSGLTGSAASLQGATNIAINVQPPGLPPVNVASVGNENAVRAYFVGSALSGSVPFEVSVAAETGTGLDSSGVPVGAGTGNSVGLAFCGSSSGSVRLKSNPAAWSSSRTYSAGESVTYPAMSLGPTTSQQVYLSLQNGNAGQPPDSATAWWKLQYASNDPVAVISRSGVALLADSGGVVPSPLPPIEPPLSIACPTGVGPIEASSSDGAAVAWDPPVATMTPAPLVGCEPRASVACTPASGSVLPIGVTPVTCTAAHPICGNVTTCNFQVSVRDTTPPTLFVPSGLQETATSSLGAVVHYDATAFDLVDGWVAPGCAPASGSLFPLGVTTVRCAAADAHGNEAVRTFPIAVTYSWSGLLPPIRSSGDAVYILGRTLPVKFKLTGASAGITDAVASLKFGGSGDTKSFRYDPSEDQYTLNLSTEGLAPGTVSLVVDLGDGVARITYISLSSR
jgi:hypothetical protein